MKKMAVIFIFCMITLLSVAQSPYQWQQMYGGGGIEVGYSVKSCLGQGYIVAGNSSSLGPTDGYVVRTDSMGVVMWEHYYGGVNIDVIRSIKLLSDSGFIMAGFTNSYGNGGYDCWVIRIDKNGDTLWTRTIGTSNWDFLYDVTVTYDSGFVFAGGTYGMGMGNEDMLFFKLDSIGGLEWIRTYGGIHEDEARGICQTSDSLLAACGYTFSEGDSINGDSWILRMDPIDGDTIWSRLGPHPIGEDKALGIAAGGGRFGVVGQYTTSTGDRNAWVHVMINDSTTQLNLTAGISGYEYYSGIVFKTSSYNFATLGSTENDGGGNGDVFMFHDVNYMAYTYGTLGHEQGYSIDITHTKGYIVCGSTDGFGAIIDNLYLVKVDSNGMSTQILDVRDRPVIISNVSVHPNPASNYIQLTLDGVTPVADQLNTTIYDVVGNVVMTISSNEWTRIADNSATCRIDVQNLPDGFYQFTLSDETGVTSSGKFVVTH
jgi:hypothetical protein